MYNYHKCDDASPEVEVIKDDVVHYVNNSKQELIEQKPRMRWFMRNIYYDKTIYRGIRYCPFCGEKLVGDDEQ